MEPVSFDQSSRSYQDYTLSVSEVARWFFGKTSHWIRWLDREGWLNTLGPDGTERQRGEAREYTLGDVQDMAVTLHEAGKITETVRDRVLHMVRLQAEIYRMFDIPYEFEGVAYPLTVNDVAKMARRSPTWVRAHAESLGGVKRQWDEETMQTSWRFPEESMDEKIHSTIYGEEP